VDLHLSPDQELLRAATRQFLERTSTPDDVRRSADEGGGFDPGWWRTAAELGWTSQLVPAELGGETISDNPLVDLGVLAEEAGRFTAPGPLAMCNTVVAGLGHGPEPGRHASVVDAVAAGTAIATWAVYEPEAGFDPLRPTTTARRDGNRFVIDGTKDRVEFGAVADHLLVGATVDGALTQFLVPADLPGVRRRPMWSLDATRTFATVELDGVVVDADAVVGRVGRAEATVEQQCRTMFVLQSAETAGATDQVLGRAVDWAFERFAFGRPLASYQALKHRFADMATWVQAMHATTESAAASVGAGSPDAGRLARVAKLFTSTRSVQVMQECVQIHGGIGVTWEHDLHLSLRRATVNRALYATPAELRHDLSVLVPA
jgi:alkylation response protein AidB-like acyl-CoA dehydrogenase